LKLAQNRYTGGVDKENLLVFNNKHMEEEKVSEPILSTKGVGKIVVVIIIALLIVAGVTGYAMITPKTVTAPEKSSDQVIKDDSAMQESPTSTSGAENSMMVDEKGKITVEGSNFKFAPNKITVKKGQPITIVFKNTGGIHDLFIDEFSVKTKQIKTGESEEVTFTPDKTGSFEIYCSVGNHRTMGMVGTLTVTP
jgi:plastocyanin